MVPCITGKVKLMLSPLPLVVVESLVVPLVFFIATTFCAMGEMTFVYFLVGSLCRSAQNARGKRG
jgi:hypothetical protein